jgi:hypothetical protein
VSAQQGSHALVMSWGPFARCGRRCDDRRTPVQPAALTRYAPAGLAIAGIGLAAAIAAGAVAVPDLAGAISDATRSLGGWTYVAVAALIFLETTALVGFVIHGELALLFGGGAR